MVTSSDVLNKIALIFNVKIEDIKAKIRPDELIFCRKIFVYICANKLKLCLSEISKKINRDKTYSGKELRIINRHIIKNEPKWLDAWSRYEKESKILKSLYLNNK